MQKPKVYITQNTKNSRNNYSPAHNFGEPIFITHLEYKNVTNAHENTIIVKDINKVVEEFNPEQDYLIMTGDPIIIGLTIHYILKEHGYLTVLKWDKQDAMYTPIKIG